MYTLDSHFKSGLYNLFLPQSGLSGSKTAQACFVVIHNRVWMNDMIRYIFQTFSTR